MPTTQNVTKKGSEVVEQQAQWTTEAIVDELAHRLCTFKIAAVACTLDYYNKGYDKNIKNGSEIHISNKYIKQAEQMIYRIPIRRPPPEFLVSLSDLTPHLRSELVQLHRSKSHKTMNYIVQHAISIVFEGIDERYFHLNIGAGQIKWRLIA